MAYPPVANPHDIPEESTPTYPAAIWRYDVDDDAKGYDGGTDDIANYPIAQLANRTKYLKAITNGMLEKSVAGNSNVALTAGEAANGIIKLTGLLTGSINVTVPDGLYRTWVVINGTTGAYSLTFKTATGAGVLVPQGGRGLVFSDGTVILGDSGAWSTSGYQVLPSGLIIQMGYGNAGTDGVISAAFPIAFPNRVISCVMTESNPIDTGSWDNEPPIPTLYAANRVTMNAASPVTTLTGIGLVYTGSGWVGAVGIEYNYIAIGY